ncbi:MAG: LysM peptidoglycan-binding domain-containing protein, partial [Chloroflexi bacterium]|nr:LysM peptidoglycan-binding domain-containing protein [Chloroflexota bacterium]
MLSSSLPAILHLLARSWRAVVLVLVVSIALLSPTYGVSDAQEGGSQQVHTVQSGENLFRIALRYGLTVDTLAAANGITDPTRIYAGQQLVIPGSAPLEPANEPSEPPSDQQADPAPSSGAAPIYHIVQRGQTLAAIGRQYGVAWGDLASWNSITDPNQIYAGQRLVVNNAAATDSPAVAGPTIEEAPAAPETPSEPAP